MDEIDASLLRQVLGLAPVVTPTSADWDEWVHHARLQRVVPLLTHLVERSSIELADAQMFELRDLQADAMIWAVRLEHHLLECSASLLKAGVDIVVLKGLAVAHLDYPDPEWRQVGDIDVLVSPDQLRPALRTLSQLGWAQGYQLPRQHERFTHAVTMAKNGIEFDLHQRLAHRSLGLLLSNVDLFASRITYQVADRQLFALSPVDRLIHAAIHAFTSHGPTRRLSSVADVLLLADAQKDGAAEVLERAERFKVRPLVERGVFQAYGSAHLVPPSVWLTASKQRPKRRDRLVEAAYGSDRRRPVLQEAAYLRLLDWGDRRGYVSGHLRPGRGFVPDTLVKPRPDTTRLGYLWSKLRGM